TSEASPTSAVVVCHICVNYSSPIISTFDCSDARGWLLLLIRCVQICYNENMKRNERGVVLPIVLLLIAALITGGTIYFSKRSSAPPKTQEVKDLEKDVKAKEKELKKERAKLDELNRQVAGAFPRHFAIRLGFGKVKDLIRRTDSLFNFSSG